MSAEIIDIIIWAAPGIRKAATILGIIGAALWSIILYISYHSDIKRKIKGWKKQNKK